MAVDRKEMTVREAGKKGGTIVSQRYGKEFYEEIGHKGGQKVKELIEAGKKRAQQPAGPPPEAEGKKTEE